MYRKEKLKETLKIELEEDVIKAFPEDESIYETVKNVFQHVKYYFPRFEPPTVYTSTTDVAYETKVILSGKNMVIGLDNYLGSNHYFYEGIQTYFKKNMNADRLPRSEEHTSELQSRGHLVCRLLLEKKKDTK